MNCLGTWVAVELRALEYKLPADSTWYCVLADVVAGRLQYLSYCVPVMWRTANALQLNRWSETGSTPSHIPGYVEATWILDNTVDANQ